MLLLLCTVGIIAQNATTVTVFPALPSKKLTNSFIQTELNESKKYVIKSATSNVYYYDHTAYYHENKVLGIDINSKAHTFPRGDVLLNSWQWQFEKVDGGYQFKNVGTGRYLPTTNLPTEGTQSKTLETADKTGAWTFVKTGYGKYYIKLNKGSKYMSVKDGYVVSSTEPYAWEIYESNALEISELACWAGGKTIFDIQGLAGVTKAENYSTNADQNTTGNKDGDGLSALIDGNAATYFHSSYQNDPTSSNEKHYIKVNMGEPVSSFYFYYNQRNNGYGNDRPTVIKILGSDELNGTYTDITTVNTTCQTTTNFTSEKIISETAYQYLRFDVQSTNTPPKKFFTASEFYVLNATKVIKVIDETNNYTTEDYFTGLAEYNNAVNTYSNKTEKVTSLIFNNSKSYAIKNIHKDNGVDNTFGYLVYGNNQISILGCTDDGTSHENKTIQNSYKSDYDVTNNGNRWQLLTDALGSYKYLYNEAARKFVKYDSENGYYVMDPKATPIQIYQKTDTKVFAFSGSNTSVGSNEENTACWLSLDPEQSSNPVRNATYDAAGSQFELYETNFAGEDLELYNISCNHADPCLSHNGATYSKNEVLFAAPGTSSFTAVDRIGYTSTVVVELGYINTITVTYTFDQVGFDALKKKAKKTIDNGGKVGYLVTTNDLHKNLAEAFAKVEGTETEKVEKYKAILTAYNAYNANTGDVIKPDGSADKYYLIISAFNKFAEVQGEDKKYAIYADGNEMKWKSLADKKQVFYWSFTATTGGYTMKNGSESVTDLYPGTQPGSNTAYPLTATDGGVVTVVTPLGQGQFRIYTTKTTTTTNESNQETTTTVTSNAMHTLYHNDGSGTSGAVCAWNAGANSGSAWYIVEATRPTVNEEIIADFDELGFTASDKFPLVEGANLVFASEIKNDANIKTPQNINNAIEAYIGVTTDEGKVGFMSTAEAKCLKAYKSKKNQFGELITINFTMNAEYGTMCLPCPSEKFSNMQAYKCNGCNGQILNLDEFTGNYLAYQPYIIKGAKGDYTVIGWLKNPSSTTEGWLTGVTSDGVKVPTNSYILALYNDKIGFYQIENGADFICEKYKCYLTDPDDDGSASGSDSARAFYFDEADDDTETGISIFTDDIDADDIVAYDLSGRRVEGKKAGIYIVNGKKVIR